MHTVVIAINVTDEGTDLEGLLNAIEARPAVLSCCDITTLAGTAAGEEHMVLVTVPTIETAENLDPNTKWSGAECPIDPSNCWVDDATGEHVNAHTNDRTSTHQTRQGG